MRKLYFHKEVFEGVTRVQAGPFGEVLQHDEAVSLAKVVIALANGKLPGFGHVLFEGRALTIRRIQQHIGDLKTHISTRANGSGAHAFNSFFGSRRIQIVQIPFSRLAEVLKLCWERAPLLFGVPKNPVLVDGVAPNLSRTVTPSVEYLKQWHSLGSVFYHGAWVAFSVGDVPPEDLLERVVACFRNGDWECVISSEPM